MSETAVRSKPLRELRVASWQGRRLATRSSRRSACRRVPISSSKTSSNSGRPRQRRNTGRSATSSGTTTLAGCRARSPPSRTRITSAHTGRSPAANDCTRAVQLEPVLVVRSREEQDRPRGMPLGEPGKRALRRLLPVLRHPREVGHHARALVGADAEADVARRAALPARVRSRRRSTPCVSGSATRGRRAGSARRRSPGPTCPPRSSGTTDGRAATPRRSRRRATTAPRPRPCG